VQSDVFSFVFAQYRLSMYVAINYRTTDQFSVIFAVVFV